MKQNPSNVFIINFKNIFLLLEKCIWLKNNWFLVMMKSVFPLLQFFVFYFEIIWICYIFGKAKCGTTDKLSAIKDRILKDYDKTIRPTYDDNVTHIEISFIPKNILDFDEEKGLLTMNSLFYLTWSDSRLSWDANEYSEDMVLPQDVVWVPDISVLNGHSTNMNPSFEVPVILFPSGFLFWLPTILTTTACSALSQTTYPFDELECEIVLGSWSYEGWEININNLGHLDDLNNFHSRWELIVSRLKMNKIVRYEKCCPEYYFISITINLPFKRRPVPEIEASRIPCILIITLTLSVFWLPSHSNNKYQLVSFLMLCICTLIVYVACTIGNPLVVLLGVSFLRLTMYIGVISVLLQVLIVTKVASCNGPFRPATSIINFLSIPAGKYFLLPSAGRDNKLELDPVKQQYVFSTSSESSIKDEWILVATALDRLFFLMMLFIALFLHHI